MEADESEWKRARRSSSESRTASANHSPAHCADVFNEIAFLGMESSDVFEHRGDRSYHHSVHQQCTVGNSGDLKAKGEGPLG